MDLEELDPALNIIIRVSDTGWLARDFDNFDLMQRSKGKPVQHALDMTGGKGECENYATVTMNPLAPIFHLTVSTYGANRRTSMRYMRYGRLEPLIGREKRPLRPSWYGFFALEAAIHVVFMQGAQRYMMMSRTGETG